MEPDSQLLRVHHDSEIAVVCVVILFEQEAAHGHRRFPLQIVDRDPVVWFNCWVPLAPACHSIYVVPAVAADYEWDIEFLAFHFYGSRVSLIVVCMSG